MASQAGSRLSIDLTFRLDLCSNHGTLDSQDLTVEIPMPKPMPRERLVKLAERIVARLEKGELQVDVAQGLGIPQSRVSQLSTILMQGHPDVVAAWRVDTLATVPACDLSGLDHDLQLGLLKEKPPAENRRESMEWGRKVAAAAKRKTPPETWSLRILMGHLRNGKHTINENIAEAARAGIEHAIGRISREELLQRLETM